MYYELQFTESPTILTRKPSDFQRNGIVYEPGYAVPESFAFSISGKHGEEAENWGPVESFLAEA